MKTKHIPDQPYFFQRHFHIAYSGLIEPVERSKKKEFKLLGGGLFGKKVNDLMIALSTKQDIVMTDDDWEAVLECMKNAGSVQGLDGEAILMEFFSKKDQTELGISLMQYVKKKKVPSLVLRTAFISMCGKKYPDIVFREYEELLKQNFSVDAESYLKLIKGFSQTNNWKKCLEFLKHLQDRKESHEKGTGLVLKAAFANNDLRTINHLLSETCEHYGLLFLPEFCTLEICLAWKEGHIDTKTLLKILSEHKGYLNYRMLNEFQETLNRKGDNFKVHSGQIIQRRCTVCGQALKGETITASQVETLKERLHKYITTSNTVYIHSNPKRYKKFCDWMEEIGPFDLVFDVANIYYINSDWGMKIVLKKMKLVREMMAPKGNVLYVLPKALENHFKASKQEADKQARIYITEWKANDDLFMFLAVLYSGPQCYIVSGDHFKDMKHNLGDDTKQLFELWQRCQQILVTKDERVDTDTGFMMPPFWKPEAYKCCVQKHVYGWHVPYIISKEKKDNFQLANSMHGKLLCLQRPH